MTGFTGLYSRATAECLATALGDMILAWTQAEEEQTRAMAAMLDIDINDALRFYQNFPNFRSRTQMLYTLLDIYPAYETIRKEVAGLGKPSKTRNRYIHGGYIQSPLDHSQIVSINYAEPDEGDSRAKPVKAEDVTGHAEAVRLRANNLRAALNIVPAYKKWSKRPVRGP
jgi:hypothetical protein